MLIEYAGDILPSLATAVGGQIFAPYFAGFLPLLLKKTVSKNTTFTCINLAVIFVSVQSIIQLNEEQPTSYSYKNGCVKIPE